MQRSHRSTPPIRSTSSRRSTPSCSARRAGSPSSRPGSARSTRSTRRRPPVRRSTRRSRSSPTALEDAPSRCSPTPPSPPTSTPSGSTSPSTLGKPTRGHAHVVTQAWERLEDVFIGLGFQVAEGPEVETDWHNFEALNMGEGHPARGEFDTLFVDHVPPGEQPGRTVLRTHTSPVQIRTMLDSGTADLHRGAGPRVPSRHARRHAHAGLPSDRRVW